MLDTWTYRLRLAWWARIWVRTIPRILPDQTNIGTGLCRRSYALACATRVEGILYEGRGRSVRLGIVRVARVRVPSGAVGLRRKPCLG